MAPSKWTIIPSLAVYSRRMQWLDEDFADSCDFALIGLSSHLPPHRISWELNQRLEWHFRFNHVLEIPQRSGSSSHAIFRFEAQEDSGHRTLYLIENKVPGGIIARFQGAAALDYLIQVFDDSNAVDEVIQQVRGVRGVNYTQELDPLQSGAIEHLALMDLSKASVQVG